MTQHAPQTVIFATMVIGLLASLPASQPGKARPPSPTDSPLPLPALDWTPPEPLLLSPSRAQRQRSRQLPSTSAPALTHKPVPQARPVIDPVIDPELRPVLRPVLRIATWNLSHSVPDNLVKTFHRSKPVWRTTFGARTEQAKGPKIKLPNLSADIIALQSVTDMRVLRRIFSARDYHIIVSRQLLRQNKSSGGTTAIAVRRKSGLRVIRQQQLLRFAGASLINHKLPHRSAALAILVKGKGVRTWVLSLDRIIACRAKAQGTDKTIQPSSAGAVNCERYRKTARAEQDKQLDAWLWAKRQARETVILAGSFARSPPSSPGNLSALTKTALASLWDRHPVGLPSNFAHYPTGTGGHDCSTTKASLADYILLNTVRPDPDLPPVPVAAGPPAGDADSALTSSNASFRPRTRPTSQARAETDVDVIALPGGLHCPVLLDVAFGK